MVCKYCGRRIKKGDYVFGNAYCCADCLIKIIRDLPEWKEVEDETN